ncbi:6651_t:CDS:1, partial [Paraglomus occultum]
MFILCLPQRSRASSQYLPKECLDGIFINFQDDKGTLFNCLFVCRYWYYAAAEILWQRPFSPPFRSNPVAIWETDYIKQSKKRSRLIQVYVSCLGLTEEWRSMNLQLEDSKRPFFNYVALLREFHLQGLYNSVREWVDYYQFAKVMEDNGPCKGRPKFRCLMKRLIVGESKKTFRVPSTCTDFSVVEKVVPLLCKKILDHSQALRVLSLDIDRFSRCLELYENVQHHIPLESLSKITSFEWTVNRPAASTFVRLAETTQNLKTVKIWRLTTYWSKHA